MKLDPATACKKTRSLTLPVVGFGCRLVGIEAVVVG